MENSHLKVYQRDPEGSFSWENGGILDGSHVTNPPVATRRKRGECQGGDPPLVTAAEGMVPTSYLGRPKPHR